MIVGVMGFRITTWNGMLKLFMIYKSPELTMRCSKWHSVSLLYTVSDAEQAPEDAV